MIPSKVLKELLKGNNSILANGYIWEVILEDGDYILVKWDKQGYGYDVELPDSLIKFYKA